jgi:processive 1,2-diacylglycerol beta-glucosyltransferase
MITLINTATNAVVGSVTEAELQFLIDNLEETSPEDTDYFIDQATIDLLAEDGRATDHLLTVLRGAVGATDGVELRWKKQ